MTTTNKTYPNITVATMFPNEKFGKGALLSAEINGENFDAIQKQISIGNKLVLSPGKRKDGTPVTTKNGEQVYFLKVFVPKADTANTSDI